MIDDEGNVPLLIKSDCSDMSPTSYGTKGIETESVVVLTAEGRLSKAGTSLTLTCEASPVSSTQLTQSGNSSDDRIQSAI
jgi:hypothetical protein